MKYVTRQAPPPPCGNFQQQQLPNRPLPAMNKPKPPRPPPPKIDSKSTVKEQQQPIKLFTNLFGVSKKTSNKSNEKLSQMEVKLPPPRIPPPVNNHHNRQQQSVTPTISNDVQLINFDDSPPASPVSFIKKSNTGGSDSVSMDSFCSTNSSPNNFGINSGTTSQAESGFEDDFSVSDFKVSSRTASRSTTISSDPFDCLDEISSTSSTTLPVKNMHANIRNMKPQVQPKPISIGNTNFYTTNSGNSSQSLVQSEDSLNNGKNLIKPSVVSMPTIIKPASSLNNTRKPSPIHVSNESKKKSMAPFPPTQYKELESTSDESFEDELQSPPMPTIPAPVLILGDSKTSSQEEEIGIDENEKESFGIALYDFDSDVTEDLNFKANEKIYLLQQMNDEWMYGRNKRGCEGIFPVSYIDIKVPLKNPQYDSGTASRSESVSPAISNSTGGNRVRVLYSFNAETDEDLTIIENDFVNVIYEINSEWLYGSNSYGQYGQFPSNFIEFIPHNLPPMPK